MQRGSQKVVSVHGGDSRQGRSGVGTVQSSGVGLEAGSADGVDGSGRESVRDSVAGAKS